MARKPSATLRRMHRHLIMLALQHYAIKRIDSCATRSDGLIGMDSNGMVRKIAFKLIAGPSLSIATHRSDNFVPQPSTVAGWRRHAIRVSLPLKPMPHLVRRFCTREET